MKRFSLIYSLIGILSTGLVCPLTAAQNFDTYNDCCCENASCDGKFTIGADWLYWKVQEDSLINASLIDTTDPLLATSDSILPKFKYDSGFRVNVGYELPNNGWDLGVSYLYLPSNAHVSVATADINQFINISYDDLITPTFNRLTSLSAKWDLNISQVDAEIGRTVCLGNCFTIRPHIGFRALLMHQKLRLDYTPDDSTIFSDVVAFNKYTEKLNGYGVEGGLWANWNIAYGFSLVGHVGGSLLYSKYTLHEDLVVTAAVAEFDLPNGSATDTIWTGTPTVEYFVGLHYAQTWNNFLISGHVGWEQRVIFDANRFRFLREDENLSAQGLTLGLAVGF